MFKKKMNKIWDSVFDDFEIHYPEIADRVVDWYPSSQMEITIKVEDGTKYRYDFFDKSMYRIFTNQDNCDDEVGWRNKFARELNRKIRNFGYTQEKLSDVTGISRVTISKYSNGTATPSSYNLIKIAKALECSVSELTTFSTERG